MNDWVKWMNMLIWDFESITTAGVTSHEQSGRNMLVMTRLYLSNRQHPFGTPLCEQKPPHGLKVCYVVCLKAEEIISNISSYREQHVWSTHVLSHWKNCSEMHVCFFPSCLFHSLPKAFFNVWVSVMALICVFMCVCACVYVCVCSSLFAIPLILCGLPGGSFDLHQGHHARQGPRTTRCVFVYIYTLLGGAVSRKIVSLV